MRLFWQEMKKIWRPGILAAIVLIGVMFYWVRPDYYREYYGGHRPIYQLSVEWAEKYGTTMEQSERNELEGQLEEEKAAFARQLADIPEALEAGVTDFDSYQTFWDAHFETYQQDENYRHTDTCTQREHLIRRIQGGTNYERINELDYFMFCYDLTLEEPVSSRDDFLTHYSPQEQARVLKLEAMDRRGYLPEPLQFSTSAYFRYLSTWNIMGAILLLAPTSVRDRLRRMRSLQWSSRMGRKALNTQMAAGAASALLFSLAGAVIYSAAFLANGMLVFKDFSLYNGFLNVCTWFDVTYGQYILILVGLALLAGLIAGALTLFLSYYSGNYVAMLLKAVPLYLALWITISTLEDRILFFHQSYLMNGDIVLHWPKGLEFALFALLLAAGLGLCFWTCVRQQKKELL